MPLRGDILTGRFDQRARCFSSSNAKRTLRRCFSSRVERKEFAAVTIRAVGVCAAACCTKTIAAHAHRLRAVLADKEFTFSAPFGLVRAPRHGCLREY